MEKLLTISDVSELTGLSKSTLYKLTSKNGIKIIKLGRRVLFKPSDVDEYISNHCIPVVPIEGVKNDSI